MSSDEKLVNRILSAGSGGIKKTDLRREFGDIDAQLEVLISKGDVLVDKRANAYFCFHKSYYIQSLLNLDPKFKLTYEMIDSINKSISSSNKDLLEAVQTLSNNISNLASVVLEMKNRQQLWQTQKMLDQDDPGRDDEQKETLSVHDFKEQFDVALSKSASSIGWIELAEIRNKVCNSCNISSEEFYQLVAELTSMDQDRYELSTGGREGVMVRGLLHGFVRCIC
ncbi:MAG TPA: hypothetical protein VHF28_04085 [Nitrososphaera sp.]|jgi:Asp-tRNA(Asn)/Glu-tRNA(Gln) amidotransferase C subunit|nr:hypothetical protein [Nitrososphaera sp.]